MQDEHNASQGTEQLNPRLPADMPMAGFSFSLRSLMIAISVFCLLIAVLVPSVRHLRRQAQETQCQNNLKHIALAFHIYHDVHKTFPCAITYAEDGAHTFVFIGKSSTLILPHNAIPADTLRSIVSEIEQRQRTGEEEVSTC